MKKMLTALKNYMKEYNKLQVEWMRTPGFRYQAARMNAAAHGIAVY